MNKRSPEQWQVLFAAHQQSGLSQAQFCKQHHLCPKYFSLRRKQLSAAASTVKRADFVRLQHPATGSASPVSLHYQGITLRFSSADAGVIAAVMKQLTC